MVLEGLRYKKEMPELRSRLEALEKDRSAHSTAAVPSRPTDAEWTMMRRRVAALNGLKAGTFSPTAVLSGLEDLLPPGARVVQFQGQSTSGHLGLVVETRDAATLSKFLGALESSGRFIQVALEKQVTAEGKDGRWMRSSLGMGVKLP
jgi:hypothetical protein